MTTRTLVRGRPVRSYRERASHWSDPVAVWRVRWAAQPWQNGDAPKSAEDPDAGEFHSFHPERTTGALPERRCVLCGLIVHGPLALGRYDFAVGPEESTNGMGGHPACLLYGARACPHLRRQWEEQRDSVIAYVVMDGSGIQPWVRDDGTPDWDQTWEDGQHVRRDALPVTYDQLRAIAAEWADLDPWRRG